MPSETVSAIKSAVEEAFAAGKQSGRFIDVSKIPLICHSIVEINENIKQMREEIRDQKDSFVTADQFWPVKTIVYGTVGSILLAVLGTGLILVLRS